MMGNKNKLCQHKDIFERMNYLYQASHLMALIDRCTASYFGNNMVGCAKKAVLRMEPNLKRSICKCCQTPLIPGETARVRLTSKPIKRVKWTCLTCMHTKQFPTRKGHKLWLDQPEAIIETLDYTPKPKNENVKKSDAPEKINEKRNNSQVLSYRVRSCDTFLRQATSVGNSRESQSVFSAEDGLWRCY